MIPASVRREVLNRDDNHCVAPVLDENAGQCEDRFGRRGYAVPIAHLECHHVRPEASTKKPPDKACFLVALCPGHHNRSTPGTHGSIWAHAHIGLLREYLHAKEPAVGQLPTSELFWSLARQQNVDL